jgi:hypothetical protein
LISAWGGHDERRHCIAIVGYDAAEKWALDRQQNQPSSWTNIAARHKKRTSIALREIWNKQEAQRGSVSRNLLATLAAILLPPAIFFPHPRPVLAQNGSVQVRSHSQEVRDRRGLALLEFLAQTPGTYSIK